MSIRDHQKAEMFGKLYNIAQLILDLSNQFLQKRRKPIVTKLNYLPIGNCILNLSKAIIQGKTIFALAT